jgi:hypothetical protein
MRNPKFRKFTDNPLVVLTHLRTKLYWKFIADKISSTYKQEQFITAADTLNLLLTSNKSVIRVGDGTFGYLLGSSIIFNNWQFRYNHTFAKKLDTVLIDGQTDKVLFCYPYEFILKSKGEFTTEDKSDEWSIWVTAKVMLARYLKPGKLYGSSFCFHPTYNPGIDFLKLKAHFSTKHIIIITSNIERFLDIKLGLSTNFIEGPSSNAWEIYEELEQKTFAMVREKDWAKNDILIMVSAAEAAKVMVSDFSAKGYTAWDTGQFFDLAAKEISGLNKL